MSSSNKRVYHRAFPLLLILPILLFTLRALAQEAPSFPALPTGLT